MRVAIGVIFVSLLGGSLSAGAVTTADQAASYSTPGARGAGGIVSNTTQDAINFSKAGIAKAGIARDDRRLASLDPSLIVYSQTGYGPNVSQGFTQVPLAQASLLDLSNSRLFPRQDLRPAALHHTRTLEDFLLMGFVAVMLIVYQLRKKHRFLRPHPFSY